MLVPLLTAALCLGGQAVDTYGKTEAEILKMGQSAWYTFYTSKAGDSTAGMSDAYGIYADIASARNDRLLADPHLRNRVKISRVRKMLLEFGSDMLDLGTTMTGGGTMWNSITAQEYAEAQDTTYALIHPMGQTSVKRMVVSNVLDTMAKFPDKLKQEIEAGEVTEKKAKNAEQDIRDARALYLQIVKVAATFDRTSSDRILKFCWNEAQQPISF